MLLLAGAVVSGIFYTLMMRFYGLNRYCRYFNGMSGGKSRFHVG